MAGIGCWLPGLWFSPLRGRRGGTWRGCGDSSTLIVHLPKPRPEAEDVQALTAQISVYVIRCLTWAAASVWTWCQRATQQIVRNSTGVFLRDKSSKGIWVNSNKLGKEICLLGSKKQLFVFMSVEATSDSFPPELTTKYTVSKVLGKGARFAQGCHQDQLQAHNRYHCQRRRQLLQLAEQGINPSFGEPPVHHKPWQCEQHAQFLLHRAGPGGGQGAV